ncbi:MAG: hypothetical protein GY757_38835, partial [bacterium]|nr:hypothetical protein [bacterium]
MSLFSLEWRRFTARNNLVVFLLYWGLALFFVYDGVQQYKDIQQSKENFCRCEQMKLDLYINYSQYGGVGFRILSLPSPLSVFFSNS